jgi:hypothetical protein
VLLHTTSKHNNSSSSLTRKVHFTNTPPLHHHQTKIQKMKNDNSSNLLLTGSILLANLDFTSILDYSVKAFIGGAIWMGFRVANDYISKKNNK